MHSKKIWIFNVYKYSASGILGKPNPDFWNPRFLKPRGNLNQNLFPLELCGSRKYPYSPYGRSLEIPRGRELLNAKLLESWS